MHLVLKTLLNHVERLQGFVYESSRLIEGRVPRIEIQLRARERPRGACSDMWQPYLNVIAERAPQALNILDRYHIAAKMNKAIDEVRAKETREVRARNRLSKSSLVLKHSRWCLLKRVENLTARQTVKLKELLACNLRTVRAYLLKEQFQFFWEYASAAWAGKFLEQWCAAAMRTRLEPMNSNLQSNKRHVVS